MEWLWIWLLMSLFFICLSYGRKPTSKRDHLIIYVSSPLFFLLLQFNILNSCGLFELNLVSFSPPLLCDCNSKKWIFLQNPQLLLNNAKRYRFKREIIAICSWNSVNLKSQEDHLLVLIIVYSTKLWQIAYSTCCEKITRNS